MPHHTIPFTYLAKYRCLSVLEVSSFGCPFPDVPVRVLVEKHSVLNKVHTLSDPTAAP